MGVTYKTSQKHTPLTELTLICKQCKHEWIPRTQNPQTCPKCKTYKWKQKKEE